MTATPELSTLPRVQCAPWCEAGDGHLSTSFRDDQTCYGISVRTPLTLQEPIEYDRSELATDFLLTDARRGIGEQARIHLGHNEDTGVSPLPHEARQLIQDLQTIHDEIETAL